jgi:hypothetical protein
LGLREAVEFHDYSLVAIYVYSNTNHRNATVKNVSCFERVFPVLSVRMDRGSCLSRNDFDNTYTVYGGDSFCCTATYIRGSYISVSAIMSCVEEYFDLYQKTCLVL